MDSPLTIRKLIDSIENGQVRIPAFQRGFVWDASMVAYLMDSIYKGYPFGNLLFWRTREKLKFERTLGPFDIPQLDPDYPVDYVLDGQQRITSIFGVFQTDLPKLDTVEWSNIYFDYRADPNAQESQFVALEDSEVDLDRYFSLNKLYDVVGYRDATSGLNAEHAKKIDDLQSIFKEAFIPFQQISTDDKKSVAIVFERVNRRKVDLDTMQLLSAWTWSEDFDLQNQFSELSKELSPFGFGDVGEDNDLLLRCCAAIVADRATAASLVDYDGDTVRSKFDEVKNGLFGAIDFLRNELNVHTLDIIPSVAMLIPLTVFFAVPGTTQRRYTDPQRRSITKWFWRNSFMNRYRSQPTKTIEADINLIRQLKNNINADFGNFSAHLDASFFIENSFRLNSVASKTFVLLLAQNQPRSFISGSRIDLDGVIKDYNRNEFHHIYPRAFLRGSGQDSFPDSCLANICFMSASDNNNLGGDAPSAYNSKMPQISKELQEILESALCPESIFEDNYQQFVTERAELLARKASNLMQVSYGSQ